MKIQGIEKNIRTTKIFNFEIIESLEGCTGRIPEITPGGKARGILNRTPGGISEGAPEGTPDGIHGGSLEWTPGGIPDGTPGGMPDEFLNEYL